MIDPGTDVVIVQRPGRRIVNGSVVSDWENPVEHEVAGCEVQGGDTREDHVRASGRIAAFTVFAPLAADIHADDRIRFTYAGREFSGLEVDGDPVPLADPILGHLTVSLVKREG